MLDLRLTNFRNFKEEEFKISPPALIVGPNAVGKTNIVEAIFLLATANSFRKSQGLDFIQQGKNFAKIALSESQQKLELRLLKERGGIKKEAFLDQRKSKLIEFINCLSSVVFSPESLHIIKGPPQERRSFLNIVLSQANQDYLYSLLRFQRVKRERNRLLLLINKGHAQEDELDFWDQELIKAGSLLIKERLRLIAYLNQAVPGIYQEIAKTKKEPQILFQTNIGQRLKPALSLESIEKRYQQALERGFRQDLRYQTTSKGPHRDEILFFFDKRRLPGSASQGEIRSLAFALKMAEKKFLAKETDRRVIFLLDDPLSELDQGRAQFLLRQAQQEEAIITALPEELNNLSNLKDKFQIIELRDEENKRVDQ